MKLQLRGKYWDKILFLQDWLSIPWALIMDLFQNTCVPINEKLPVRKHEKKNHKSSYNYFAGYWIETLCKKQVYIFY